MGIEHATGGRAAEPPAEEGDDREVEILLARLNGRAWGVALGLLAGVGLLSLIHI